MNFFIRLILAMFCFVTTIEAYEQNDFEPSLEEIIIAANLYQDDWK